MAGFDLSSGMSMKRPLPFVLAASDLGPMIVSRLDFAQNPHGFYGVGYQILHTGSYDGTEVSDILSVLSDLRRRRGDGIVVLDCGANIGVHTLALAREMTGWGEVYAFEAQERLFYALAGNVALGNFFNAKVFHAAVGSSTGTLNIPQPDYYRSGSLGSLELRCGPKTEFIGQKISYAAEDLSTVSMLSIDSLSLPRVDFIKLDVEGMEIEALEGARETLLRSRPTLLIEWIKVGQPAVRDFLTPLGYRLKEMGMNLLAEP